MEMKTEDKCLEFGALMREAIDEQANTTDNLKVDLSFLNDISPDINEKRHKRSFKRILKVAAVLICFFTVTTATSMWMISQEAYAFKYNLQRKLYMLKDGFASSNDSVETDFSDDNNFSITINDIADIEDAQKLMPDLPIPAYIPDGFTLDTLTVTKWFDGAYDIEYIYSAGEKKISILAYKAAETEKPSISINVVVDIIEMEDRTIAIWHDIFDNVEGCSVLMNDILMDISGDIDKEELIEIAKAIN